MQEQDQSRTVGRRKLLRRAGTVAAGAAGAGVVGSMVGSPAQAAPGDPVVIGAANTGGTTTTTLTSGNATNPTLRLNNAAGPALSVQPIDWTQIDPDTAPAGSVYVDTYGDYNAIGEEGGLKFHVMAYSPTWATMPIPLAPFRWVDTRNAAGRANLLAGSTFDSAGRLMPKNSNTVPDAIVDLSPLFAGGYGAVQANLTVVSPVSGGYASLWDEGPFPEVSNVNYGTQTIANFTQTLIGSDSAIRVKTNKAAIILIDITGFILTDPFTQFPDGARAAMNARGGNGDSITRWQKRVPRS
nr:hypothetical protein [Micromonospora sp. DSM 115978]